MSFRKEFKFRLTNYELLSLKSKLLKKGMLELYPRRFINSLYFDTLDHKFFEDSEEGTVPRTKIRVRWYGRDDKLELEKKISSNEGRFKISEPISENKYRIICKNGFFVSQHGFVFPSLKITYSREYFMYKNLRVTFDRQISYFNHQVSKNLKRIDNECVVEVKTTHQCPDDYVLENFPYPVSRFSKYSRGLRIQENSI